MTSTSADNTARLRRLDIRFRQILDGKSKVVTPKDAEIFVEAVVAQQSQKSPSYCVESLVASPHGVEAVRSCVRADLSASFIQSYTLKLIGTLTDPSIKSLANGQCLWQLIQAIVVPTTLWNALFDAFLENKLDEQSLLPFAWLVHELAASDRDIGFDFFPDIQTIVENDWLLKAEAHETREFAYKIQKILQLKFAPIPECDSEYTPGGRHDNDFADFRQISVYPTTDELLSMERPFYRPSRDVFDKKDDNEEDKDSMTRAAIHLDNQFRLLREDMLGELRNDLQVATGKRKGRRAAQVLGDLIPQGIMYGDEKFGKKCSIALECRSGLSDLKHKEQDSRRAFLKKNTNYLRHQAFGALLHGEEICGFAFIERDIDLLAADPPIVCLQFTDQKALQKALLKLKSPAQVKFVLVDTPVFAYEPVLKVLQGMSQLPLARQIMDPKSAGEDNVVHDTLSAYASTLRQKPVEEDGCVVLDDDTRLDQSQLEALLSILEQEVSFVQGPPGCGKTFIATRAVKAIYNHSTLRVLIISYTNHALDQSLEGLLDVGIPQDKMVRLGSKSTPRTDPLLLRNHANKSSGSGKAFWARRHDLKEDRSEFSDVLKAAFGDYMRPVSFQSIQDYLEFSDEGSRFYMAFTVPSDDMPGWRRMGKKGKTVKPDYLFQRWARGDTPGIFTQQVSKYCESVWDMPVDARRALLSRWTEEMVLEHAKRVAELVHHMDTTEDQLDDLYNQGKVETLKRARIIGCTTTAAAMNMRLLRAAEPDVVLVEEAGEILESHVLTALSPSLKRLIQIGDHKQLRPKVKNYSLTVEKGDGFNLNVSMFERLVTQGFPHATLQVQHRMHPELSWFPRALTYPELKDGGKTSERQSVDGVRDRVIFINHEQLEKVDGRIADRLDGGAPASKSNLFEAKMVLAVVRYLAQQGYGTNQMVVLTPYLGQLRLLVDTLQEENDPVLNDLDSAEMLRAGLMTAAESKMRKKPLRISTIDNYQGEESDIVIASLTRSNPQGDIGFMSAHQRLNVLITRARCCLVLIGNMDTFMASKKGKDTWIPYFELLKDRGHLYDGFPAVCVRHPETTADLATPEDFDKHCPDGGCAEPCNEPFACGIHTCKRRCHRLSDHSQTACTQLVKKTCSRLHKFRVACANREKPCEKCAEEDREMERRVKRDLELERTRLERQSLYRKQLQEVQDELDRQQRAMQDLMDEEKEKSALQKAREKLDQLKDAVLMQREIKDVKEKEAAMSQPPADGTGQAARVSSGVNEFPSKARDEWEHLKKSEGAKSAPMDELMGMVGLEEVKEAFMAIKHTVDTKLRQNVSLGAQRYGAALLGNPGTGKTTVARIYARFLSSIGAVAGSKFEETTGAALANKGVAGCKQVIDDMLNEGGGVIFLDEAYQLTSGANPGGLAVLDYILAEVENLTGKVVFVLAGYNKQMETLFAHNPGLPSRFPYEMKFADYSDDELLHIFRLKLHKQYRGAMRCEDEDKGLYCRIVSRRIGRGRGKEGFGNARTVENTLAVVTQRQATRLALERKKGLQPDHFLFTKEDLIGPRPSEALSKSKGWTGLQKLIGLGSVKEAVRSLVDSIEQNYLRELAEQPPIEYSLNKVFLGNPGVGKTTVAKLYGQVLVDLGLLSKNEVVVKNPSDFVGAVLGASEATTKGILASTVGKVLVIDEAYGLYSSAGDIYKTAVIDTLVAEIQSVPGEDRCVLLLGYKDQMENMFQNVNPGLSRRFPISSAFSFEDFTEGEMRQILDMKLNQQGFTVTGQAKKVAMEMLERARNRPNYGNAGEVDILLDATKARHQTRFGKGEAKGATVLEALDFDEKFDRGERSETNVAKLFEGTVGSEEIIAKLQGYQETVSTMRQLGMDPKENVPFNFLFRGPPGTGKTTTARKMGKVFYDMGFLSTAEVVDCSASDLVGKYVGQTGPKVINLLDKALGRVLFVDEAYRLGEGHFAKEAMDELVDSVTKPRYFKRMVIILAGYTDDINRLMSTNAGLSSRFPEVVDFRPLHPSECVELLTKLLAGQRDRLAQKGVTLDMSALERTTRGLTETLEGLFQDLIQQANWASARDVETIAKGVFMAAMKDKESLAKKKVAVTHANIAREILSMFNERKGRANATRGDSRSAMGDPGPPVADAPKPASGISTATPTEAQAPPAEPEPEPELEQVAKERNGSTSSEDSWESAPDIAARPGPLPDSQRDAGVSDEVWEQLQRDKQAELDREAEYQRLVDEAREAARQEIVERLIAEDDEHREEEKRRQEEEKRRREETARRLIEMEKRREAEMLAQEKLAKMGRCPAGYQWIKQASGWRCAGGSHYLSNGQMM